MRQAAVVLAALFVMSTAAPAHAQLGALGKLKKGADRAADAKQKVDDLTFSEAEEKQIGEQVSLKLRDRFGVYQNEAVTKYVSLVGNALAQASSRPSLDWKFIVLDTDGVNAYAAPGGFIHITRGLLGLMKDEAELAGVLGHEITHVTAKHTLEAIRRSKLTSDVTEAAGSGSLRNQLIARIAGKAYESVFDGAYSRGDENESDKTGVQVANKIGYAPHGLADALQKVADRNASRSEPNGFFVSHPVIKDRIASIEKEIKSDRLTASATVETRYKQHITFDAKPITDIATDVAGAAGLASGDKKKDDDKDAKKDEPKKDEGKKRGFGLSSITGNRQAASTQQTASAGARGGVPDRDAKGGPNKSALGVKITAAELDAFKKGIAS
jgi:beta-barrel assembly-enhancing protease